MKLFNKIKSFFGVNQNIIKKIEKIEEIIPKLEQNIINKEKIIEKISNDFFECKKQIDLYRNSEGMINDFDGILLLQEVFDKMMIRFDYYYMNDGNDYPEQKIDLKFSKENLIDERKEKFAQIDRVRNKGNDESQYGVEIDK